MLHNCPCQFLTGNTVKTCQVLTSVGILRMLSEQLLQIEWSWEFSGDLRMLVPSGDCDMGWHRILQRTWNLFGKYVLYYLFSRLWLSLHAGSLLCCLTDTNVLLLARRTQGEWSKMTTFPEITAAFQGTCVALTVWGLSRGKRKVQGISSWEVLAGC